MPQLVKASLSHHLKTGCDRCLGYGFIGRNKCEECGGKGQTCDCQECRNWHRIVIAGIGEDEREEAPDYE